MSDLLLPDCVEPDRFLVDLAYEETSSVPDSVRSHVAGCSRCSQVLSELRDVRSAAAHLPIEEPSAEMDQRVLAALDAHLAGEDIGSFLNLPDPQPALGAERLASRISRPPVARLEAVPTQSSVASAPSASLRRASAVAPSEPAAEHNRRGRPAWARRRWTSMLGMAAGVAVVAGGAIYLTTEGHVSPYTTAAKAPSSETIPVDLEVAERDTGVARKVAKSLTPPRGDATLGSPAPPMGAPRMQAVSGGAVFAAPMAAREQHWVQQSDQKGARPTEDSRAFQERSLRGALDQIAAVPRPAAPPPAAAPAPAPVMVAPASPASGPGMNALSDNSMTADHAAQKKAKREESALSFNAPAAPPPAEEAGAAAPAPAAAAPPPAVVNESKPRQVAAAEAPADSDREKQANLKTAPAGEAAKDAAPATRALAKESADEEESSGPWLAPLTKAREAASRGQNAVAAAAFARVLAMTHLPTAVAEEALLGRVHALVAMGQWNEAQAAADQLAARFPAHADVREEVQRVRDAAAPQAEPAKYPP